GDPRRRCRAPDDSAPPARGGAGARASLVRSAPCPRACVVGGGDARARCPRHARRRPARLVVASGPDEYAACLMPLDDERGAEPEADVGPEAGPEPEATSEPATATAAEPDVALPLPGAGTPDGDKLRDAHRAFEVG